jgi:hypothetical protein
MNDCKICGKLTINRKSLEYHLKKYHELKLKEYEIKFDLIKKIICAGCNTEFIPNSGNANYCQETCRDTHYRKLKLEKNSKGIEGKDFIKCKWCGDAVSKVHGKHILILHSGRTMKEYKAEFPGSPVQCTSMSKKLSDKGKIQGEKEKEMRRDRISGDKNPNHKSKTTAEYRKSISPFSIDFYRSRNPELSDDVLSELYRNEYVKHITDREYTIRLDYYTNKGLSIKEAREALSERQRTFSKEKCIKKYGESVGILRWIERQERWMDTINNKTDGEKIEILKRKLSGSGCSKISQSLFWKLHEHIQDRSKLYFKEFNKEYFLNTGKDFFLIDFKYNNKIIEFQGDYWHTNPKSMPLIIYTRFGKRLLMKYGLLISIKKTA